MWYQINVAGTILVSIAEGIKVDISQDESGQIQWDLWQEENLQAQEEVPAWDNEVLSA